MPRVLTLFENGDTTITWTEESDEKMLTFIQSKMDLGYIFFIIEPRLLLAPKLTKLEDAKAALKSRALAMPDELISTMIEEQSVSTVPTPKTTAKSVRKAKTAKEVIQNEAIGTRQHSRG